MIANYLKTQIFHKMKYDLKGHERLHKVNYIVQNFRIQRQFCKKSYSLS